MGVILDTSVVIRAERRKWTVAELLERVESITGKQTVGLSAIGVTEIVHGIYRAGSPAFADARKAFSDELTEILPVFDYTLPIARLAGRIDGEQQAIGSSIPFADLLIGATALSLGFSILTANERHFRLIPNLEVISF